MPGFPRILEHLAQKTSGGQALRLQQKFALLRVIPTMTFQDVYLITFGHIIFIHILTFYLYTIVSGIYSGIYSDILSDIYSGILSDIYADILSAIYSDTLSGISSEIKKSGKY